MSSTTKISSKNRILQRTGDQTPESFAQDRVQQRLVVPAKMVSQTGIRRPAPVLPERSSERICGQSGVNEVTCISSQDRHLQRAVEQDSAEVDKTTSQEPISERIRVIEVPKIASQESWQRTVQQILDDTWREPISRISVN